MENVTKTFRQSQRPNNYHHYELMAQVNTTYRENKESEEVVKTLTSFVVTQP